MGPFLYRCFPVGRRDDRPPAKLASLRVATA